MHIKINQIKSKEDNLKLIPHISFEHLRQILNFKTMGSEIISPLLALTVTLFN